MKKYAVFMQRQLTAAQKEELVEMGINPIEKNDLSGEAQKLLDKISNINPESSNADVFTLAAEITARLKGEGFKGMVFAGEPSLTFALGKVQSINQLLGNTGFDVAFATSEQVSVERVAPDGATKKETTFKHVKFRIF